MYEMSRNAGAVTATCSQRHSLMKMAKTPVIASPRAKGTSMMIPQNVRHFAPMNSTADKGKK